MLRGVRVDAVPVQRCLNAAWSSRSGASPHSHILPNMGHWAERLVDEAAAMIGPEVDHDRLRKTLLEVGKEIDILSAEPSA